MTVFLTIEPKCGRITTRPATTVATVSAAECLVGTRVFGPTGLTGLCHSYPSLPPQSSGKPNEKRGARLLQDRTQEQGILGGVVEETGITVSSLFMLK